MASCDIIMVDHVTGSVCIPFVTISSLRVFALISSMPRAVGGWSVHSILQAWMVVTIVVGTFKKNFWKGRSDSTEVSVISYNCTWTCIASSPGLREGEGREGLVSAACACAVIMHILNNPIMYGFCLIYLPFDLNFSHSTYLEMISWTVQVSSKISR